MGCYVFIRLLKMSARLWTSEREVGAAREPDLPSVSVNAPLMICLKTLAITIMLIKMENSEFFIDA